jgi:hypothetical protein
MNRHFFWVQIKESRPDPLATSRQAIYFYPEKFLNPFRNTPQFFFLTSQLIRMTSPSLVSYC